MLTHRAHGWQVFNNPAGCGHPPGTCSGRNELWSLTPAGSQTVRVTSRWNSLCLAMVSHPQASKEKKEKEK